MRAHCPKCGSAAKFVSQKPHTMEYAEVVFRCDNPKCGGEVLAQVTFSMRKTPAEKCFSGTRQSGSAGRVKPDC